MSEQMQLLRVPRLAITGYIDAQYEQITVSNGDSNTTRTFSELLGLNFTGFLVDRRLLHYKFTFEAQESQGDTSGNDFWRVGLYAKFLPFRPLRFDLRATYTDGEGYTVRTAGASVQYTRYVIAPPVRMQQIKQQQQQLKPQQQEEEAEEEDQAAKQKVKQQALPTVPEKGFFYYFLPRTYFLDLDTYNYKAQGSDTSGYDARLLMKGSYGRTQYFINLANYLTVNNITDTSTNRLTANLITHTNFKNASLSTTVYYSRTDSDGGDSKEYGVLADLAGYFKKRWDYLVNAYYQGAENSVRTDIYSTNAEVGSTSEYKKTLLSYRLGASYYRSANSVTFDNAALKAFLGATRSMTKDWTMSASTSATVGTDVSIYTFYFRTDYRATRRLSFYASYRLTDTEGEPNVPTTFGATSIRPTTEGMTHLVSVGAAYTGFVNLAAGADYSVSRTTESEGVSLTASTTLRRVNVSLGAYATWTKPRGDFDPVNAQKNRTYTVYNLITSPFFMRNSFFYLYSHYDVNETENIGDGVTTRSTTLSINPILRWFWRRLIIEADGRYSIVKTDSDKTKETRILVRVRRPFRLL